MTLAHWDEVERTRREAAAAPLDLAAPSPRPTWIVAFDDTPVDVDAEGAFAWTEHDRSHAAGSSRREGNEIVAYPRSRKARVGQVMVRLETVVECWDGEGERRVRG